MRGTSWTGEVVDLVHFDEKRIDNVMMDEFEVLVADPMLDITFTTRKKIINYNYFMPL